MKFLVDNQLPPALARFITAELNVDAVHVLDVGLGTASDDAIWRYASINKFILISKDEDFVDLYTNEPATGLLWIRKAIAAGWHFLKRSTASGPGC